MKREPEQVDAADLILCVLLFAALGLGLAWAF